jgi:hypothetical protein
LANRAELFQQTMMQARRHLPVTEEKAPVVRDREPALSSRPQGQTRRDSGPSLPRADVKLAQDGERERKDGFSQENRATFLTSPLFFRYHYRTSI